MPGFRSLRLLTGAFLLVGALAFLRAQQAPYAGQVRIARGQDVTPAFEGWVRNRHDGSVEALLGGSEDKVVAMIAECRRGPPGARVDAIDQREATSDEIALRHGDEIFSVLRSV